MFQRLRCAVFVTVAVGAVGCAGYGAVDETAVVGQVGERMNELQTALLSGNVEAFMDFFTEDVHVLEPGVNKEGQMWGAYVEDILNRARVVSLDIEPFERFVHGNAVYEMGQYDEVVRFEGQEPMTVSNHYFLRWERGADGVWRIDRMVAGPRTAPEGM